jgi:taurine dioxygenase
LFKIEIVSIEENMDFRALSPFGIELHGVEITKLQAEDIDTLKNALADNGFVIFRQQSANDADFASFLDRLGQLTFTIGETPVAHRPELNVVSNIGRTTPPRSVFHTDTSYIAQPPAYTGLDRTHLIHVLVWSKPENFG